MTNITDLPSLPFKNRNNLPEVSAIYFIVDPIGTVVYVGQTYNLRKRWINHHRRPQIDREQYNICWMELPVEVLNESEAEYITAYAPEWNNSPVIRSGNQKVKAFVYEYPEHVKLVDELAQQEEVSRAELYRRAMWHYLVRKGKINAE